MLNKIFPTVEKAIADVTDGSSIMIGGFGFAGTPYNLVQGLIKREVKELTIICQSFNNIILMPNGRLVKKVVMSFTQTPGKGFKANPLEGDMKAGKIEVELVPEGTLVERIRAGGAGLGGFYTSIGVGTVVEIGKEKRLLNNKEYLFEEPLRADFAFIKGFRSDRKGNIIYRKAGRNFNPVMATAARITICEVEQVGDIDSEVVYTPGIFVDRVVEIAPFSSPARKRKE